MISKDDDTQYKLVAPDVDSLLGYFDHRSLNPNPSTSALLAAFNSIFEILSPLAPLKKNNEAKAIWIRVPRGSIENYTSFEDMREWEEVETYEEYEKRWLEDYPEEFSWYELVAVQSFDREHKLRYYGISLGNERVISAMTEERGFLGDEGYYPEEAAVTLCKLILPAVQDSIDLLRAGAYNELVEKELPYQFRTGVIRRKTLWEYEPEARDAAYDGLSENAVQKFKELIASGANEKSKIGRIMDFTANDFFRACKVGYEAIGKDCNGFSLPDLYMHYADGRDEGLTGQGHGLNAGPGIDFDSPAAWNDWYFGTRGGGHPWEVVPGGNSTHVELYICNDQQDLGWKLRAGEITQEEYDQQIRKAGYFFEIAGKQRQFEAVSFYLALTEAGYPVIINDAEELLARFEASDYIGIVPHHLPTRYCENLFPKEYGDIIDFTHAYKNEDAWFEKIEWLPEEETVLVE